MTKKFSPRPRPTMHQPIPSADEFINAATCHTAIAQEVPVSAEVEETVYPWEEEFLLAHKVTKNVCYRTSEIIDRKISFLAKELKTSKSNIVQTALAAYFDQEFAKLGIDHNRKTSA